MKKISVIVPLFNGEKTIQRCLDSILAQTYQNFEILVINDGSTDHSSEIVETIMKRDNRVFLINKEHTGVSAARNLGLSKTTGELLQFVDADDYLEPNMFERMSNVMEQENADIVVCNFTHPCIKNYLGDCVLDLRKNADRIRYYQTTFSEVVPWNKLYKRSVITEEFDVEVGFNEDDLFGMANIHNVGKLVSLSEVLYHYYSAPVTDNLEEASAITKIAKSNDFWETKQTFFYMRQALLPKAEVLLDKFFAPEEQDDFRYARIFDFMIWEIVIFNALGTNRNGMIKEMQNIFREEDFISGINYRNKYGITMKKFSYEELNKQVLFYVEFCMNIQDEIMKDGLALRPFYIDLYLFVKMFCDVDESKLDEKDVIARAYIDYCNLADKESRFLSTYTELEKAAV